MKRPPLLFLLALAALAALAGCEKKHRSVDSVLGSTSAIVRISRSGAGEVDLKSSSQLSVTYPCSATNDNCRTEWPVNSTITLNAVNGGTVTWSGPCTGNARTCQFLLLEDENVTAVFN